MDFGFEIEMAENGKIAIDLLQNQNEYDIMDLQVMNGFETSSYIHVLNSKIPIIALTADVTTSDVEKISGNERLHIKTN
jgi:CheY-like chemotaxis protein